MASIYPAVKAGSSAFQRVSLRSVGGHGWAQNPDTSLAGAVVRSIPEGQRRSPRLYQHYFGNVEQCTNGIAFITVDRGIVQGSVQPVAKSHTFLFSVGRPGGSCFADHPCHHAFSW